MSTNVQLYRYSITVTKGDLTVAKVRECFAALAKKWVFQEEAGEVSGVHHFQCRMNLKQRMRRMQLVRALSQQLDIEESHVTVRAEHDASASTFYCMKLATRVAGPWADAPIYMGADLAVMAQPLPWQSELLAALEREPDDRSIVWIHNPVGNVGKSKFCKWLVFNKKALRIPMGTATQIKTSVIAKGPSRCYVLDIPRVRGSDETRSALMSAIEDIKNGWVESAMYGRNDTLFMDPPHVVVFSNDEPPLHMASADRWVVKFLDSTGFH